MIVMLNMEINYTTIAIILLAALVLIFFLTKRNVKDKKEFEKEMNKPEEPEVHKEDSV